MASGLRADGLTAIDTLSNKVIATSAIGQAPQAIVYVPNAVPDGAGTQGLQPLGLAGQATHLALGAIDNGKLAAGAEKAPTSVSLFDQGLIQVLQAAVTGLQPKQPYVLALAQQSDGKGTLEPLVSFMTNAAGSAIVDTTGPIRQVVQGEQKTPRRYLVIVPGTAAEPGKPVQLQIP
jgi:hypothetical protein